MTFDEAIGFVLGCTVGLLVILWYLWCIREISKEGFSHFFSLAYDGHSTIFIFVNGLMVFFGLVKLTIVLTN